MFHSRVSTVTSHHCVVSTTRSVTTAPAKEYHFFKSVVKFSGIHYTQYNMYMYICGERKTLRLQRCFAGAQTKSHFLATVSPHAVTYVTTLFCCFYFQHTEIGYMISDVQRIVSAAVYIYCSARSNRSDTL